MSDHDTCPMFKSLALVIAIQALSEVSKKGFVRGEDSFYISEDLLRFESIDYFCILSASKFTKRMGVELFAWMGNKEVTCQNALLFGLLTAIITL
jgi:hypothetical protein